MSVEKVRGGRRMDASYDTDGDEIASSSGRNKLKRNLSFKGNSSVDHAQNYNYKPLPDSFANMSLDRRDRPSNPLRKAMNGFRNIFRNLSNSSPSLQQGRRAVTNEDVTNSETPARRQRAYSVSQSASELPQSSLSGLNLRTKLTLPGGRQPGCVGIDNHGNTCFMNAVIQCLSNTDLLLEYLLNDEVRKCLNSNSQRCVLTGHLVMLIKSLWTGSYEPEISGTFKEVVGECAEQYSGTAQNDAQEFLLWLLDTLNEELCNLSDRLNPIVPNGHKEIRDKKMNSNGSNSIIFDLFQAKYRSTLTCPSCRKQSDTYDPFLSVSLPIQQKNRLPVYVTVAYASSRYQQRRYGLMMTTSDTVGQLRKMVARMTGIAEQQLLLTQIYDSTFQTTLEDQEYLNDLDTLDFIYGVELFEISNDSTASSNILEHNATAENICIVAMNRISDRPKQSSRFGGPFVVKVSRDLTFMQLRAALLSGMRAMIPPGSMEKVVMESGFFMRVVCDITGDDVYLQDFDELPLYAVTVDEALSLCSIDSFCPPHIKLVLEWRYTVYKRMLCDTHPPIIVDTSYQKVKDDGRKSNIVDLQDCFNAFTQQEQLSAEDTWFCPNCHKYQKGTIKSLNLCSLPDVMIVHLKRFKQEGENRSKLNTLIKFPINGLDMTYHLTKGQSLNNNEHEDIKPGDCIYDLYGVCNHDGNMSQGHYRAICKNPLNGQWFYYDDSKVTEVQEDRIVKIVTRTAYLLFYRKRNAQSRCDKSLKQCMSQLLDAQSVEVPEPRRGSISKSVHSERSFSDTRQLQTVRSNGNTLRPTVNAVRPTYNSFRPTNNPVRPTYNFSQPMSHSRNSLTYARHPVNPSLSASYHRLPPTGGSFHASMKKPMHRKVQMSHSAMDSALAVSTPEVIRSPAPPVNSPPPTSTDGMVNGKLNRKRENNVDLPGLSDPSTVLSALEAMSKMPNQNNVRKLKFEKAPSVYSDDNSDGRKQTTTRKHSSQAWQRGTEKFIQESSV